MATLQFLSQNRTILRLGVGWVSAGIPRHRVNYDGPFFNRSDVLIEPRTERRPEIWIGGASQLANDKPPDLLCLVPAVRKRILRSEGWIPRPTCPPDDIARDWREISCRLVEAGGDPAAFTVAHENFMHLVMTNDPNRARQEQHRAFLSVMSQERGADYLESVYLFGTPDELVDKLQARVDAGVRYFMLHTLTPELDQLEHWMTEVVPHVRFPESATP